MDESQALLKERLSDLADEEKVQAYMDNPNMMTYGTGKYVGVAMNRAGLHNVAEMIKGYAEVTLEQVCEWNPEVIFVQDRYIDDLDIIKSDPGWAEVDAVKNNKLYVAPEYTKLWGHPCPESYILGELWLAKTFYPDRFEDVDLDAMVEDFYQTFYGISYSGEEL